VRATTAVGGVGHGAFHPRRSSGRISRADADGRPFILYMNSRLTFLAGAVLATVALSGRAQPEPAPLRLGAEKAFTVMTNIQIRNFQDDELGRIGDLGVDLINGRIVEVLVISDSSLDVDNKVVAVPPLALIPDLINGVYRLDATVDTFRAAAAIDFSKWTDAGRSDRVAAAYRLFGQDPYFLEEGDAASKTAARPKVALGYVERSSKLVDLPVGNYEGVKFGKVWSMTLDIPNGRILSVIVLAPGNFQTKSVIPAKALDFNSNRDGLLLDQTKLQYEDEPRYVFTEAAFGQDAYTEEESYKGPRTRIALEQGRNYRDVDRTVLINKNIRAAKINARNVQVGTKEGRVTLRGWVYSAADKQRIAEIAITASRLELVDNQLTVGKPSAKL
jgi:sporulation protein YlmC with PRC-barrel domain